MTQRVPLQAYYLPLRYLKVLEIFGLQNGNSVHQERGDEAVSNHFDQNKKGTRKNASGKEKPSTT